MVQKDVVVGPVRQFCVSLYRDDFAVRADQLGEAGCMDSNVGANVYASIAGPNQVSKELSKMLLVGTESPKLPLEEAR